LSVVVFITDVEEEEFYFIETEEENGLLEVESAEPLIDGLRKIQWVKSCLLKDPLLDDKT
jgi:hypothetical protein